MALRRFFVLSALVASAGDAQWLDFREPGVPRTRDGKADMTAPTPKAPDGKRDLSGVWMHETTKVAEMKRFYGMQNRGGPQGGRARDGDRHAAYMVSISFWTSGPEDSLMRPETVEQMRRNHAPNNLADACTAGFSMGFPPAGLVSESIKIVQARRLTMILYEAGNFHRQIYTDGRVLSKEFDLAAFNGYLAGHWEGDALVVETAGFNNKNWLDGMRHPHRDALRVLERFRRRDFGHLDYEIRFEDLKMYTKPFSVKILHELLPDSDIFENY